MPLPAPVLVSWPHRIHPFERTCVHSILRFLSEHSAVLLPAGVDAAPVAATDLDLNLALPLGEEQNGVAVTLPYTLLLDCKATLKALRGATVATDATPPAAAPPVTTTNTTATAARKGAKSKVKKERKKKEKKRKKAILLALLKTV